MSMQLSSSLAVFLLTLASGYGAEQQTLTVAAAADLSAAEPSLSAAFVKQRSSFAVRFVNGASATLAEQIKAGAPFNLFLSANVELIDQLRLDSPTIYAVGHVAILWKDGKAHPLNDLRKPSVRFVALPNPQLAPYGLAAVKALQGLQLWESVKPKVVYGENVRQALELLDSGNADAVLTSASLVSERHPQIVPSVVVQKAGIVPGTRQAKAAKVFLDWLVSPSAQEVLARYGFDPPPSH